MLYIYVYICIYIYIYIYIYIFLGFITNIDDLMHPYVLYKVM